MLNIPSLNLKIMLKGQSMAIVGHAKWLGKEYRDTTNPHQKRF